MNEEVANYIGRYSTEIQALFMKLRELIIKSVPCQVEEKLWARLPSYYVGDSFIRLIPFKDHINIEAKAIIEHKSELKGFKLTPKSMLQIYCNQGVPYEALQIIFKETILV